MAASKTMKSPDASRHAAGLLFIVSAPSGAGKTTLCKAIKAHFQDLAYSISYTSRTIRDGEKEGRDYHFISEDEFKKGIDQNRWAEWAHVHGNYYGTSVQWINQKLGDGKDILMDIDVQGARQMVAHFSQAVTIFIMPPSVSELERRLKLRAKDDPETIALRLKNARKEIDQKGFYRYVVVNDDLEAATQQLIGMIDHHRSSRVEV